MKTCTRCNLEKTLDEFNVLQRSPDGRYPQCRKCKKEIDSEYYEKNRQKVLEKAKEYYNENKEKILAGINKEEKYEYNKKYRKENSENLKLQNREYKKLHKDEISQWRGKYRKENRDKINEYSKHRLKTNPLAKLAKQLRGRLQDFLADRNIQKSQQFKDYLGCSLDELKLHIEKQFQPGMTWENYGSLWSVDHNIALANAPDSEKIYELCHYLNLRPMFCITNSSKNSRSDICWQKLCRDKLIHEDKTSGMPFDREARDFELKEEKFTSEHREFIERYEWLGTIGFSAHYVFTARYNGLLAGVVLIGNPNSFQFNKEIEMLIQRGACSSWAPKNLNSRLVSFACNWMVDNTEKRIFVAYSDFDAGEYGTIYQACNFDYLGGEFGSKVLYPSPSGKLVSSRYFTQDSAIKKIAKENNIEWDTNWNKPNGYIDRSKMPEDLFKKLMSLARAKIPYDQKVKPRKKGKYVLLINKGKKLYKKTWEAKPYPKRVIGS